jgi:hypothetical protein
MPQLGKINSMRDKPAKVSEGAVHWQKLSVEEVWLLSRSQTQGRKPEVSKEGAIGDSVHINTEFTSSSDVTLSIALIKAHCP